MDSKNSACHRCNINQIELICYDCSPMNSFCRNCDSSTHSIPSKRFHKRDIVSFEYQNEQQNIKKKNEQFKSHKRTNIQTYENSNLKKEYYSHPVNHNLYNRKNNDEKRDYSLINNKEILEYAKEKNRTLKIKKYENINRKLNFETSNDKSPNKIKLEDNEKHYYGNKLDFPVVYEKDTISENKENKKEKYNSLNENNSHKRNYSKSSSNFNEGIKPSNFNNSIKSIDENLNFINNNASVITSNTNNLIGFQNGSTLPNFKDPINTSIMTLHPINNNYNNENNEDKNNDYNNDNENLIICYDHENEKTEDIAKKKKMSNKSIKKYEKGTFEKYEKYEKFENLNKTDNNNNNKGNKTNFNNNFGNNFNSIQSNGKKFSNTIQHEKSIRTIEAKCESSNNFYSKEYVNELKNIYEKEKEDLTYKVNLLQTNLENIKVSLSEQIKKVQFDINDNNNNYEKKLKNLENQQRNLSEKNVFLNAQDSDKEKTIENLRSQMLKLKQSNSELQEKYDYHFNACKKEKKMQQNQFDELQIKITQKENEIEDLRIYYDRKIEEIMLNTSQQQKKVEVNMYSNENENNNLLGNEIDLNKKDGKEFFNFLGNSPNEVSGFGNLNNYEFSLGNKNDAGSLNNFDDNAKENQQNVCYFKNANEKNINNSNILNNDYLQENISGDMNNYTNTLNSNKSKIFYNKLDDFNISSKEAMDLKLELRDLKKLFYTLRDDNQNLYENFEDQKREINKKSEDILNLETKLFSFKQENYSLKSKLNSIQFDVDSYKKYNNPTIGGYNSSNNFYNTKSTKENSMKKKFIDISQIEADKRDFSSTLKKTSNSNFNVKFESEQNIENERKKSSVSFISQI